MSQSGFLSRSKLTCLINFLCPLFQVTERGRERERERETTHLENDSQKSILLQSYTPSFHLGEHQRPLL